MPISMRRLLFIVLCSSSMTYAQIPADVFDVAADMVFLSGQYVDPAAEAAVYQSSGGWYTSAKTKELWDVEISVQGNLLFIPNKSKNFVINNDDLANLQIKGSATSALTPTALGEDNFVVLEGSIDGNPFEFDSPEGINESYAKHAQIQASVGLWKGTAFTVRYSPKIKFDKTYYQIIGVGLQHSISQWMPKLKESTFHLAGLITYSNYSVSDSFSAINLPQVGTLNSVIVDGQSFMFNVIASKEVKNFDFAAAIGVTSTSFVYSIGGDGAALSVLNQTLDANNESKTNYKIDLGVNYRFYDFSINSMITFGSFTNLVLGLNYNI